MTFNRSDDYVKQEHGGETLDEFFRLLTAASNPTQELLNAINGKRTETVASRVQSYREQVGLDLVEAEETLEIKTASKKGCFLSKRHKTASLQDLLQSHPELAQDIDSFSSHSGGHKDTHSILHALRDKLGPDVISYSDQELIAYIESRKEQHKDCSHAPQFEVGAVGIGHEEPQDQLADYFKAGR
jgi:hypothetical protein